MEREQWLMTGAVALAVFAVMRAWWLRRRESAGDRAPSSRSFPRREQTAVFVLLVLAALLLVGYLVPGGRLTFVSTWLVSLIIVAATWLVLRARAYRRALPTDDEGHKLPFSHWLGEQLAHEWPLLAVLMVGPTIALPDWLAFRNERPELALFALALVTAWWLVDWRANPDAHPLRNPLGLLAEMLRQLWRYKALLAVLVVCWLASAGAHWALILARYPEISERLTQAGEDHRPSIRLALTTLNFEMVSPRPHLPHVAFPDVGAYTAWMLHLILAAWLIWLMWRPPSWLPAAVRERLRWPAHLLVAGTLVAVITVYDFWFSIPGVSIATALAFPLYHLLPAASAPLLALLLWILLRIARRRPWGTRQAVRVSAYCWGSVAILVILFAVPGILTGPIAWSWVTPGGDLLRSLCRSIYNLMAVALALVPWLIVDRRMRLWPALAETWRLATSRAGDVLVFAIRYWLLMMIAAAAIQIVAHTPGFMNTLAYPLLQGITKGLGVLTIAAAYLALQGTRAPAAKLPRTVKDQTRRCERCNT